MHAHGAQAPAEEPVLVIRIYALKQLLLYFRGRNNNKQGARHIVDT